jgi:hypothetical protein
MSSTCTFELADYPIEEMKCYPIPELMVFFRERDRRVFVRKVCERNALVWGSLHGDDSKEQAFTYSIRICEFKSRLDYSDLHSKKPRVILRNLNWVK